ncbi:sugar ABC transporter permease [Amycolatopsis acidiphila]|uniref:Sugar ABC transporter permease n=1 Tax=Amycolatopsis acidiphila TaxID=715473 RepID=A0A558AM57_9PSEU|nr:sugar ABC transporter permease [Amycolatopsis acidiphila]TVT25346.1 sugar ABC transporter permease [Amycolatopsis acidiphila]UIJ62476.1 sugar ABC transporter permease [Amycolatopsis acidiphila]GHG83861.1 ABC transporter permease [Amycolatopsis acidiphila]
MTRAVLDKQQADTPTPQRRRRRPAARRVPYWLMSPSFLLMAVVTYLPLALAVFISLTALNQFTIGEITATHLRGLLNYLDVLAPSGPLSVLKSLRTSVFFSVLTTAVAIPIGIGAALLANRRLRGRSLLRTVMLLPFILPAFASALIWRLMFQTETGLVDRFLGATGLGSPDTIWLIGPNSFWALVITGIWTSWPFIYIMVLAVVQSVPHDYYEAAAIDGAGTLRQFWSITLPAIRPTLALAACLSAINHFNNFTLPFVLFGSPPPPQANVLPIAIYTTSFTSFDFGHASAIAVVNLLVLLIPVAYYLRRVNSHDD